LKIGLVAQNHHRPVQSDALIGHLPAGVDLAAIPLQRAAEVRSVYSALEGWLATKLAGPPPASEKENRGQAVWNNAALIRDEIAALLQNADVGVFDADGIQHQSQARVLGYGFSQDPTGGGPRPVGPER
jgi:hypothetical protein